MKKQKKISTQQNGNGIKRSVSGMFPPTKEEWIRFEEDYKKWQQEFDCRYKIVGGNYR